MIIFLIFIINGYFISRLIEKDKSNLAHIVLFSLGTMGLISFLDIFIWNSLSLLGVLILDIPFISAISAIVIYNKRKLIAPIEYNYSDFFVLGILFLFASQQFYGEWDAWAMWNTKAEFLMSQHWKQLFSPELYWMHADYPLLLPSIIAGGWSALGINSPWIPFFVGLLFSWSTYLLLKDGITRLYNKTYGILGALFIIVSLINLLLAV